MKQLATITLPDTLDWTDQYHATRHQILSHTLDGGTVVFNQPQQHPITLKAGEGSTWLDENTCAALVNLAAQENATFPLIWENQTFTVAFRHHQPPAVDLLPLWPGSDQFIGTIRLMMV